MNEVRDCNIKSGNINNILKKYNKVNGQSDQNDIKLEIHLSHKEEKNNDNAF